MRGGKIMKIKVGDFLTVFNANDSEEISPISVTLENFAELREIVGHMGAGTIFSPYQADREDSHLAISFGKAVFHIECDDPDEQRACTERTGRAEYMTPMKAHAQEILT
jgi:hypothetical protein